MTIRRAPAVSLTPARCSDSGTLAVITDSRSSGELDIEQVSGLVQAVRYWARAAPPANRSMLESIIRRALTLGVPTPGPDLKWN